MLDFDSAPAKRNLQGATHRTNLRLLRLGIGTSPLADGSAVADLIAWMGDDFCALAQPFDDLSFGAVGGAEFDGREMGPTVAHLEHCPTIAVPKHSAVIDFEHARKLECDNLGVDLKPIAERRPHFGGLVEIDDDVDALFVDA